MRWRLLPLMLVGCGDDGGNARMDAGGGGHVDSMMMMSIDAPTSTSGCGQFRPTGLMTVMTTVGGTERSALISIPTSYDSNHEYPLIFAWHGRTGTSAGARSYFGIEAATAGAAIIVYPQGLDVSATPGDTGWELTENGRDVAFFDSMEASFRGTFCIGTTFSMGHSFGGYMSNALGCYRGGSGAGKVRAIASVAGGGPFGACSGDPISAVIIHGTMDTVVLPSQGIGSRDTWRTEAGCATTSTTATPSPCIGYDSCTAGLDVRYCEHSDAANMGHGWPSFAAPAAWQLFQDSI